MTDFLWKTFHRLIGETHSTQHRFLFHQLDSERRLTGIIGPRGTGKTTLLLQYIKSKLYQDEKVFYFSADNTYFNEVSILTFVDELYQTQGIRYFFIDEIHKYPNWNQELKNIYDAFPNIKLVFSGSSSIDLITGSYDLSRRAKLLYLPGLSFREYLNFKTNSQFEAVSFEDLIANHQKIAARYAGEEAILHQFNEYKSFGYYPIVFENKNDLYSTLADVTDKTIYEDIANFYTLKTTNLQHFKRILNFLASIPPGKVSTNNIAKHLSVDNKTIDHYLMILNRTGMVKMLYQAAHGNQTLTKPDKIYLDNSTLLAAINTLLSIDVNIGTQREITFLQSLSGANIKTFHPKQGDFQANNIIFEVGGKNKTWQQLKTVKDQKILVKDDILLGKKNEIPLYLFGFLY